MFREIRPAIIILLAAHADHRPCLSARHDRDRRRDLPEAGAGQPDREGRQGDRLRLIGQEFKDDKYFHGRPSATSAPDPADSTKTVSAPYNAANSGRLQPRPDQQGAERPGQGRRRQAEGREPEAAVPVGSRHHVRQRARSGYFAGRRAVPGAAGRQGPQPAGGSRPGAGYGEHQGPSCRLARRAAGQRAGAKSGVGRGGRNEPTRRLRA